MKIRITKPLAIEAHHGIRVGRIFDVVAVEKGGDSSRLPMLKEGVWIVGDRDVDFLILPDECVVVDDSPVSQTS